jgi:hypothetical protein
LEIFEKVISKYLFKCDTTFNGSVITSTYSNGEKKCYKQPVKECFIIVPNKNDNTVEKSWKIKWVKNLSDFTNDSGYYVAAIEHFNLEIKFICGERKIEKPNM